MTAGNNTPGKNLPCNPENGDKVVVLATTPKNFSKLDGIQEYKKQVLDRISSRTSPPDILKTEENVLNIKPQLDPRPSLSRVVKSLPDLGED